ncbi:hypothetical protein [Roseivivax sp. CAU 1761]
MDRLLLGAIVVVLGLSLLWLSAAILKSSRARKAYRGQYLSECSELFEKVVVRQTPTEFPRLSGYYNNHLFDIQVVQDSLTFRKLPALWVLVTLPEPIRVKATFDMVARPVGVEPFSWYNALPEQIEPPAGFPHDCGIRTDDVDNIPSQELLERYLHLFQDPRTKELLISPRGLRLVILGDEADRGKYLIYREAEMGRTPLPASLVEPILQELLKLKSDLEIASATRQEARTA